MTCFIATLKGFIFAELIFAELIFRGINFREFVIFEKFAELIFANIEILKNLQIRFCDLLALFANSAIFWETDLVFRGINFREFVIFEQFRGINFREFEAQNSRKLIPRKFNSAKINPFNVNKK